MRINVYSQELTNEVRMLVKKSDGVVIVGTPCFPSGQPSEQPRRALEKWEIERWGQDGKPSVMLGFTNPYIDIREEAIIYHAAQLMLHSSSRLHHPPNDDDRSAVTFWLPKSKARREEMAVAFEEIARLFRNAPSETGLD